MKWDPESLPQFIRPLIDSLTAVLQADWEADSPVHAEVNGGTLMAPYEVWRRSRWVNTKFPACSVIPRRSPTKQSEGGPLIDETHIVEVFIEDVGANPDTLADSVMRRIQAAHTIIGRAGMATICADYEPSKTRPPSWDAAHDYAEFWIESKSTYKQNGSLIITFTGLMEKT